MFLLRLMSAALAQLGCNLELDEAEYAKHLK